MMKLFGLPLSAPDIIAQDLRRQQRENQSFIRGIACGDSEIYLSKSNDTALDLLFFTQRRVFITTAHWENYFKSFVYISVLFPPDQKFVTIRGRPWNDIDEDALWRNLNAISPHSITVYQKNTNGLALLRELRSGAHAFVLYDLDVSYGRPTRVEFFGTKLTVGAG